MKITYDAGQDSVRILFNNAPIEESIAAEAQNLVLDYDCRGNVVGLELREASRLIHDPRTVEFVRKPEDGVSMDNAL